MPTPAPLAPQIEQFIHDNPQGVRDPRCSVLISHAAQLTLGQHRARGLRRARRHIFSATTRRRSRDWDEYDRIAAADKRVAMLLRPDHIYGTAVAKMREARRLMMAGGIGFFQSGIILLAILGGVLIRSMLIALSFGLFLWLYQPSEHLLRKSMPAAAEGGPP